MKIKSKFLKYFILGALLVWPPVHMALSKKGIINSWKFSGWGMYASTSPRQLKVKIIFLLKGLNKLPRAPLSLGVNKDTFVINDKGYYKLPKSIGLPISELQKLNSYSLYMRTIVNPTSAEKYIGMKRRIIEKNTKESFPTSFLFVSETRLDVKKRNSHFYTKVFLYKDEAVEYLGQFKSTEFSNNDLIKHLNEKLLNTAKIGFLPPKIR